jgi:hypothetical protein
MKKAFLSALVCLILIGCSQAKEGDIVKCDKCGKEISNTVHTVSVPFWRTAKDNVVTKTEFCAECAKEQATENRTIRCVECGQAYKAGQPVTLSKDELADGSVPEGVCAKCGDMPVIVKPVLTCERCGKPVPDQDERVASLVLHFTKKDVPPWLRSRDTAQIQAHLNSEEGHVAYTGITVAEREGTQYYELRGSGLDTGCFNAMVREGKLRNAGEKVGGAAGAAARGFIDGALRHAQ